MRFSPIFDTLFPLILNILEIIQLGKKNISAIILASKFISELGWGEHKDVMKSFQDRDNVLTTFRDYEEVILWFEHDLYDQLQLILQSIDGFATTNINVGVGQIIMPQASQGRGVFTADL